MKNPVFVAPAMRPCFLSSLACEALSGKYGKVLHGEDWKADPNQLHEEIAALIELDRRRAAELPSGRRPKPAEAKEEAEKTANESERLHTVPLVWCPSNDPLLQEMKTICQKHKRAEGERRKAELETAKRDRLVAEAKVQVTIAELRTKLVELKLSSLRPANPSS